MNFTSNVKDELLMKKMNNNEQRSFLSGFLYCSYVDGNSIKTKILNKKNFDYILLLLEKFNFKFAKNNNLLDIKISEDQVEEINPSNATIYLAGIFFASGSISNLDSSSYHLEISFKNEKHCNHILEFAKKHVLFNKIKNKNNYVLYLKKNEYIKDFLQIIRAQKSYFAFIDSVINRDFKNQITRIFNLDVHNQNRLVDSNVIFKENYQYIKEFNLMNKFNSMQLDFYKFKSENEFLSLTQLSEELYKQKKVKKTKSCLNHWLIKLRSICEEHKNSSDDSE